MKFLIFLVIICHLQMSYGLFHQTSQSRQSTGHSALFSHFGQPNQQLANLTSASHYTAPFYYEYDRDPRQWLGGYGYSNSPWGYSGGNGWLTSGIGSVEAVVVCLLVVLGVGVLGFPMLLLLFSLFSNGLGTTPTAGFNFIPPSSTTTVNGRRKRNAEQLNSSLMKRLLEISNLDDLLALKELSGFSDIIMSNVKPELKEKAIEYFKNFSNAPNKMEYIKRLIQ